MLPGTQHVRSDSALSGSFRCTKHGYLTTYLFSPHAVQWIVDEKGDPQPACPKCLEEFPQGTAKRKEEEQPQAFRCDWCNQRFEKFWDLQEHKEVCPAFFACTTAGCEKEVVGRCFSCKQTFCGDCMTTTGLCGLCLEAAGPS